MVVFFANQLTVYVNSISWSVHMEHGASDICVVIGSKTRGLFYGLYVVAGGWGE